MSFERPTDEEIARARKRETDWTIEATKLTTPAGRLRSRALSEVISRAVGWLIFGLIPLRALTLVAGVGGLGKTTYLAGVAAWVTTGDDPHNVLVITYEDTAEEIWRPRILAAGGDPERVRMVYVELDDGGTVVLPRDLDDLEALIREHDVRLVIIDPIVASIDTSFDAHKDQHVRAVLGRVQRLAEDTGCAVCGVGHLNKAPTSDVYMRVANSAAFWNAARSVVLVTADSDDPDCRIVAQVKSNWSQGKRVERHRIDEVVLSTEVDPDSGMPIVASRMSLTEVLDDFDLAGVLDTRTGHSGQAGGGRTSEAGIFLREALADGEWHEADATLAVAEARGITSRTLQRALKIEAGNGVEIERTGFPSRTRYRLTSRANGNTLTQSQDGATARAQDSLGLPELGNPSHANNLDGATSGAARICPRCGDTGLKRRHTSSGGELVWCACGALIPPTPSPSSQEHWQRVRDGLLPGAAKAVRDAVQAGAALDEIANGFNLPLPVVTLLSQEPA